MTNKRTAADRSAKRISESADSIFKQPSNVIASEAKQSISPHKERMDCFASLAMTSNPEMRSRSRGAIRPSR
jgi:hypothetical protein